MEGGGDQLPPSSMRVCNASIVVIKNPPRDIKSKISREKIFDRDVNPFQTDTLKRIF